MKIKTTWVIGLIILIAFTSSGWVFHFITDKNPNTLEQSEITNLQISFLKQYGNSATIKEMIIPKIYEVAWEDDKGTNISLNIGGVWVLIASQPNKVAGE